MSNTRYKVAGNNAFFSFEDLVYSKTRSTGTSFDQGSFIQLVQSAGYDSNAVSTCYQDDQTKDLVAASITQGQSLGITGTPTIFLIRASDGKTEMIIGAQDKSIFQQTIDNLLNTTP